MSLFAIPDVYPDEYFVFALWSIGHGPNSSDSWVVFHDTETDYQIRQAYRFYGSSWKISQTTLPGATFAGIIERLEAVSIPLVAEPQGAMLDGATSGFCLNRGEQVVLVTWYYPPEEWRPLVEWYSNTHNIFWKLFHPNWSDAQ
jgi:hypothetical protein